MSKIDKKYIGSDFKEINEHLIKCDNFKSVESNHLAGIEIHKYSFADFEGFLKLQVENDKVIDGELYIKASKDLTE